MIGKSKIILSEPYLGDPNFERSVILLCEDVQEGAFGFVMNKPSAFSVENVLTNLSGFDGPLYIGGPVDQNYINFIYKGETKIEGSLEIGDGYYLGGDFNHLNELGKDKLISPTDFRFFMGYSGWSVGQLEEEMENKSWIIGDANISSLFQLQPLTMWQQILKNMGGKYKMYSNFPIDPKLN